ncbi:hypothetical protein B0H15DRAFT_876493 [Mycena belliarum]|uniref:BTB domain-containing protein n=1 Tax=Mycena belliarum TaxID=1033014 RepID=A0AAD6XYE6_9AGAR|nr:hypothetical protein B0H15DRAFT_876493 [Mycena belliae]
MDLEIAALTRAEGLWFDDCGLVLQAETTIFRISREFLAVQSPIFRDMLSLPTHPDAETMDGCPFVLLPDSAEDVTVFLKALLYYDFFEPWPAKTTYPILAGVLRMSHKYEVDALRKRALVHLSSFHPTTLSGWDELVDKKCSWFDDLIDAGYSTIPLIILARQLSIDWILPVAFYRMYETTCENIVLDGRGNFELSGSDKLALVVASRLLETTEVTQILDFLWTPFSIKGCTSVHVNECTKVRTKCRRKAEYWRRRDAETASTMPLDLWNAADWQRLANDVCQICLSQMKTVHGEARRSLWARLPEMFELSDWTELEKMKAEALE